MADLSLKTVEKIPLCREEEENSRSEIAYTKHAKIMSTAIRSLLTVGKFLYEAGESFEKMQQITEAAVCAMALAIFLSQITV